MDPRSIREDSELAHSSRMWKATTTTTTTTTLQQPVGNLVRSWWEWCVDRVETEPPTKARSDEVRWSIHHTHRRHRARESHRFHLKISSV
jgi:hypothetical protein